MMNPQYQGFLNTAPLWEKDQFEIPQFEFPIIDLQAFLDQPIPSNIRLGHQMEYVFKQLIECSKAYEVVLHNLPIRKEKSTLGEIDFILRETSSCKLIHVELAYKFYIIDPEISDPLYSLIGPNRRDSFYEKIQKIKHKQIPLLHTSEGAKALSDDNIDHQEIAHQCSFKAQLFHPYGSNTIEIGTLNKSCLTGYWLRMNEFNNQAFEDAQYYLPTKSEWVVEPNHQVTWKSHAEITKDVSLSLDQKRAPMIWLRKSNGEFEKLFVVWW